ncbi:energy transducer TonB [Rhodanobacter ginsengisoli]|uniref:Energy transducer TonB n=1 Tax=Rhodanobacter ginsengisoli TaxID=418646 RepID=A0ABW0QSA6_9GAMM
MPRSLAGVSRRYALVVVSLLVVAAAGGVFWYSQAAAKASLRDGSSLSVQPTTAATDDAQSGTAILLGLARDAMHDGRLVAPAGSNAYEFYLSVLQLEPDNRTAQDALRESFPRAAEEIERTINHKDLEEARREIDLLREFDNNNFTLALLGGKLSAARNIVMKQHEAEAERIRLAAAMQASTR